MQANKVPRTEIEPWGAYSILRRVNGGVYICECSVRYDENKRKTKHAFVYDSHFKHLNQPKSCGILLTIEMMHLFVV